MRRKFVVVVTVVCSVTLCYMIIWNSYSTSINIGFNHNATTRNIWKVTGNNSFGTFVNRRENGTGQLVSDRSPNARSVLKDNAPSFNRQQLLARLSKIRYRSKWPFEIYKKRLMTGEIVPENLMAMAPFQFLPKFKNPCWVDLKRDPSIACMPYFFLVGVPKAGTTDVFIRLIKHPDVTHSTRKEPHWLPRRRFYPVDRTGVFPKFSQYVQMYSAEIKDIVMNPGVSGSHSKIFGDYSASTLWDNDYWSLLPENRNLKEPPYTNPDIIHHLNPNSKIIVMLRDPIERLYSDYIYFERLRKSPSTFHEGVKQILKFTNTCLSKHSLRRCVYTAPPEFDKRVRLRIGIYHVHLAEYFRVFPRKQILVIKLEDYSANIAEYMERIFQFLELPPLSPSEMSVVANSTTHANTRKKNDVTIGNMLNETRRLLEEFYRPHNDKLVDMLGSEFNYTYHG